nr:unnamed protein product [Digitaria exilis]
MRPRRQPGRAPPRRRERNREGEKLRERNRERGREITLLLVRHHHLCLLDPAAPVARSTADRRTDEREEKVMRRLRGAALPSPNPHLTSR